MFRALHDPHRSSQSQNANLESKRKFPHYLRWGGRKRAVIPTLKHGVQKQLSATRRQARFRGGACSAFCKTRNKAPLRETPTSKRSVPKIGRKKRNGGHGISPERSLTLLFVHQEGGEKDALRAFGFGGRET